jgi:4,5-DOPA dioxygenase extradiol
LSGGLIIHNLRDMASVSPQSAKPSQKEFDKAMLASVNVADVRGTFSRHARTHRVLPQESERKKAMMNLTKHAAFRAAHPREVRGTLWRRPRLRFYRNTLFRCTLRREREREGTQR